jgi:hypothetical protein
MAASNAKTPAPAVAESGHLDDCHAGERDSHLNSNPLPQVQVASRWRETYKVHPAADVFPMMSDQEIDALRDNIVANGLHEPIVLWTPTKLNYKNSQYLDTYVLDGRNRMEAMERACITVTSCMERLLPASVDPVAYVISLNIHRRHLTKAQQADLIVAAIKAGEEKLPQVEEVSKGGRGKVNPVKAKAVAAAQEHGISKATVERSIAKAEGRTPKPKATPQPNEAPQSSDGDEPSRSGIAIELAMAAAKNAREAAGVLRATQDALVINDELIQACKAVSTAWDKLATGLIRKRASTLPGDGPENHADYPNLPAHLDRRKTSGAA